MLRRKPIYIIGIILFSLLLLADLGVYFLLPGNFSPDRMGGFGGELPNGFSPGTSDFETLGGSDADDGGLSAFEGFGGGFTGQGDWGSMGPGMEDGNFPVPGEMELPQGQGGPGGILPFGNEGGSTLGGMSLLRIVQSAFWPVLAVGVLGNGLCIFMLISLHRMEKAARRRAEAPGEDA